MEDLLREDEFLKQDEFNLKNRILLFCAAGYFHVIVFYIETLLVFPGKYTIKLNPYIQMAIILPNLIFPLILAYAMIKRKKSYIELNKFFPSFLGLSGAYIAGFIVISFFDRYLMDSSITMSDFYASFGVGCFYLFLFSVLFIPIVKSKQRKQKEKIIPQSSSL